jgi:hypothetical protein
MEAEFIAVSDAVATAIWLHRLFSEIRPMLPVEIRPIPIRLDNTSAEAFIKRPWASQRSKYIDTRGHFVHNMAELGCVQIHHVAGMENPTDMFTKPLGPQKHLTAVRMLNLRSHD